MSRSSKIALVIAALVSAPVGAVHAQNQPDPYNPSRFTIEPFLSQTFRAIGTKKNSGAFGARVMFGHSTASQALSTIFNRARAGAFVSYGNQFTDADISILHYGVQADFPLLAAPRSEPVGFRIDPFVSLGAGVFHTSFDGPQDTNITTNDLAITPAIGTLIPITGAIKFRGDLRDAIVFSSGNTTNNFIVEGGISIGF